MGTILNNVRKIRLSRGMKQTELAKLLNVTQGEISMIENGKRNPKIMMAIRIAEILGVKLEDLIQKAG